MSMTHDTSEGYPCAELEWDEQTFETNTFEKLFANALQSGDTNSSYEPKALNINDILPWPTNKYPSISPISHNNCGLAQPKQCVEFGDKKESIFHEANYKSIPIEQYLSMEMDITGHEFDDIPTPEPQQIHDVTMTFNQAEGMRFEVDPAPIFRPRYPSELKPKDKNGKPGKTGIPRYFDDGNTRSYLNLLIPKARLSFNSFDYCLEICIVTPEINGYTYIHPYFKLQTHPTDLNAPDLNPIYQLFDNTIQSNSFSDELFQLELKLVVVMHKRNELMQIEQPLNIFSTPQNNYNQPQPTIRYNKPTDFIKAYSLDQMRFAITLWKRELGGTEFCRQDVTQYISSISKADRNYKKKSQS